MTGGPVAGTRVGAPGAETTGADARGTAFVEVDAPGTASAEAGAPGAASAKASPETSVEAGAPGAASAKASPETSAEAPLLETGWRYGRHLLSISDLGAEGIMELLHLADHFAEVGRRPIPKVPALRGRTIVTLFFESSTRTRLSFETAARRLSADVLTFTAATSSVGKGESLRDTAQTLHAMGVDAMVVRHSNAGVPWQVSRWIDASIVNAGDGWHEHPTQVLSDCFTIRELIAQRDGRQAEDLGPEVFKGLRVAIVGDVLHSRVARSEVLALNALGADVTLVSPPTMLPSSLEGWEVSVSHDLDDVMPNIDVFYLLRLQTERGAGRDVPSLHEYTEKFGLTARRAESLSGHAVVMHPGPLNRGVEIASEVADSTRSLVLRQVANGVSVRMAVLFALLGGRRH